MADIRVGSMIMVVLGTAGYKTYKGSKNSSCGCGCTGCSNKGNCTQSR